VCNFRQYSVRDPVQCTCLRTDWQLAW